jgi:hypothetical protein
MTKYVPIEEGGFGNETGPGGGGKPTGGEFPTQVTGRKLMSGIISSIIGGGGGAGMFSALEWIMKGAVWPRAAAFCGAWIPDGAEELREGEPEFGQPYLRHFTVK